MLLSIGCSPEEIKDFVGNTSFSEFEDHPNPLRVATHYGYYKGERLLKWLEEGMKMHQDPDSTFADLHHAGCKELKVYACNLNSRSADEFSYRTTPNVKVVHAVRASMGAPLFFQAWQFPDGNPSNDVYVDGGTVLNYPINAFDDDKDGNTGDTVNPKTLGFHLDNLSGNGERNDLELDQLPKYVKVLFDAVLYAQVIGLKYNPEEMAHTVRIDDFGISASKFHLTKDEQHKLYESGMKYTDAHIKKHGVVKRFGGAFPASAS